MWTTTFCPNFTCSSFTALLVIAQALVYIACLVFTNMLEAGFNDAFFLGVQPETLQNFGMRMPYLIKEDWQIWRLVTPVLLSHGFSSIVIFILLEMFIGFMVEQAMGSMRMFVFSLVVAVGSNLFASAMTDEYAAGPECLIFGYMAALIGMFGTYWDKLGENTGRKACILFLMVVMLIFAIMFASNYAKQYAFYTRPLSIAFPDLMGAIGGFIFGLFGAFVFLPPASGRGFLKG